MKLAMDQDRSMLEMLAAAITRSPIVVARPPTRLPAGFEDIDVAILDWIVAEAQRIRRRFAFM
jgi:hypothetical protein